MIMSDHETERSAARGRKIAATLNYPLTTFRFPTALRIIAKQHGTNTAIRVALQWADPRAVLDTIDAMEHVERLVRTPDPDGFSAPG